MANSKLDTLEGRLGGGGAVRGMYTPDDVAGIDEERMARILNGLVSRVNFDTERDMRRRARRLAFSVIGLGFVVGAVVCWLALTLLWHPVDDLANVLQSYLNAKP